MPRRALKRQACAHLDTNAAWPAHGAYMHACARTHVRAHTHAHTCTHTHTHTRHTHTCAHAHGDVVEADREPPRSACTITYLSLSARMRTGPGWTAGACSVNGPSTITRLLAVCHGGKSLLHAPRAHAVCVPLTMAMSVSAPDGMSPILLDVHSGSCCTSGQSHCTHCVHGQQPAVAAASCARCGRPTPEPRPQEDVLPGCRCAHAAYARMKAG